MKTVIKYYGWSTIEINSCYGNILFDPFVRKYCGVKWFDQKDIGEPDLICVTHGHEEHYLDVPIIARKTGCKVLATKAICNYLKTRNKIPARQLIPINHFEQKKINSVEITAFPWKHRDINVFASILDAVFKKNTTKLAWAWSSFTKAPFYAAYTGFYLKLPDNTGILNYNEGFNPKMTEKEINDLGNKFNTSVLLAGMQMNYEEDVARGAKALNPDIVILYPLHEHFHKMMGATMSPWENFYESVKSVLPDKTVVIAGPGTAIDANTGTAQPF